MAATVTDGRGTRGFGIFSPDYRRVTLAVVAMVLLVAFEAMAVSTAMPVAARDLEGLPLYAWAFSGFLVGTVFATVVAGELADRSGPLLPLVGGAALFTVGLLVAGTAPSMWPFVVGRVVQGLGGGAAVVALYVVVARVFPPGLRPQAFSAMSAAWVLPSIVGPLAAGLVAEHASWRLVFLGIAPVAVIPVMLALPALRRIRPGGTAAVGSRAHLALAAAVGAAALQWAGQHRTALSGLVLVAGVGLLAVGLPRLLPRGALRLARGLPAVVVMRGVLAGAFFGAEAFVPLMLVEHRALAPAIAGLALTGAALGWSTGSWWQGRPRLRTPRPRLVQLGSGLVTAGVLIAGLVAVPAVPVWLTAIGWTVAGLGMGLAFSSISVLLFELSPVESQGFNAAAVQLADGLGSVVAVGAAGTVYAGLRAFAAPEVVFGCVFGSMVLVGLVGFTVAGRTRSPAAKPTGSATAAPGAVA